MDLRQLAAIVAVADEGTFSAAADALHTVQSNISTHVARLERELGVTLVDRAAGRLTDEGEVVVARARRIQAEVASLISDVASLRDEISGGVRLGVIGTTGRWLMPPLLQAMTATHPKVHVAVLEGNTTSLLPQLISGRLDLAVVNLPISDPDLAVDPLFEEDLILVAPSDHPLAGRPSVGITDLAEHDLLLPPPGTSIRVDLDRAAERAGVRLRALAELDGMRLIASLTFEGFGAAVLPSTGVPSWLTGDFVRVPVDGVARRRVGLSRRRRGLLSAPARALQEVLAGVVAEESANQPGVHLVRPEPARDALGGGAV